MPLICKMVCAEARENERAAAPKRKRVSVSFMANERKNEKQGKRTVVAQTGGLVLLSNNLVGQGTKSLAFEREFV